MCRFLAYIGKPIKLDMLIYQPKNSLVHQSYHAQEKREPLNGDGFGVGFYVPEVDPTPAVFVSKTPAWSNRNLRYNASKIRSNCIFAHVRAASVGNVSEANCHPFHFDKFLFMHNGEIGGFKIIKRKLRQRLSDEMYDWIQGGTDSEHFFGLFLGNLEKKINKEEYQTEEVTVALEETFSDILELKSKCKIDLSSYLNLAITNGKFVVAARCILGPDLKTATLYHSEGNRFECVDGDCRMVEADPSEHAILIASEKLTNIEDDWHEVPNNHFVVVEEDLSVSLKPIVRSVIVVMIRKKGRCYEIAFQHRGLRVSYRLLRCLY